MRITRLLVLLAAAAAGTLLYFYLNRPPTSLTLTGIVTTNDVIVSPQVAGQLRELLVTEGDTVTHGQKLAVIAPDELAADSVYYAHNLAGASSQVKEAQATLRYQTQQTADQIKQAEAVLAASDADVKAAQADLENAKLVYSRTKSLADAAIASKQEADQTRTALDAAAARVDALIRQADAQRSALALARANAEQVALRRTQVETTQQMAAAAAAQRDRAGVRLGYTDITAPIDGIVDVRAARQGEYTAAGQPILTLINPDDLWVRVDVEETYIDRIRIGDTFTVRLPSGVEREGTVFYRAADAGFATQRDVSRTKRDIRTFEIRLRVDNADRRLAVGMTAYVLLPLR